ncbi:MAG: nucleoside deaminase [Actinomycetota bacterium]
MADETLLRRLLAIAVEEARAGWDEGGVPIGAVVADGAGVVLGRGHNRNAQHGDATAHGEIDALRNAEYRSTYDGCLLVTTMTPCWMCAGMARFAGFSVVAYGDGVTWPTTAADHLAEAGVDVVDLADTECISMFAEWLATDPPIWAGPDTRQ